MQDKAARIFAGRPWSGRLATLSDAFLPCSWGVEVPADRRVDLAAIDVYLHDLGAIDELRLKVSVKTAKKAPRSWELSSRSGLTTGPRVEAAQALLSRSFPVRALFGEEPARVPVRTRFSLDGLRTTKAGEILIFEISALVAGRPAALSAGVLDRSRVSAKSFYGDASGRRIALDGEFELAWSLYERGSPQPMPGIRPFTLGARDVSPLLRQPHSLTIPPLVFQGFGTEVVTTAQQIVVPRPGSQSVRQRIGTTPGTEFKTLFRHFTGLTHDEPSLLLTADGERGFLRIESLTAGLEVTVNYTGHDSRYDVLALNTRTGELELTVGADRSRDPEEYAAVPAPGTIPLYSLYTTHQDVELIPLVPGGSLTAVGSEVEHLVWLEDCRKRLPLTFQKLRRGASLRLAGYGDSITALGGREGVQNTSPDGALRDRMGYFECYGKDWKAGVETFDHGDGEGSVHHHLGWNWTLKRLIETAWGVSVRYENWGIAGTTSDANARVMDGLEYLNGAHPLRLAALGASRPDLVIVAFGMNDIGGVIDTCANIRVICDFIRANGSEALVVAPCRQNAGFKSRDPALWRLTHDAVIQGAIEAGAAWCPTIPLLGQGNEGVVGLSHRSHSAASMGNHPGARELEAVGRYLGLIFS